MLAVRCALVVALVHMLCGLALAASDKESLGDRVSSLLRGASNAGCYTSTSMCGNSCCSNCCSGYQCTSNGNMPPYYFCASSPG